MLIIFGGALLLTPGFLTDIVGLLFLLPPTRAVVRRVFLRRAMRADRGRRWPRARAGPPRARPAARDDDVEGTAVERRPRAPGPVTVGAGGRGGARRRHRRVTFAFGDAGAELYGLARLGLSRGEAERRAARSPCSSPAASRSRRSPAAALPSRRRRRWEALELAGLRTSSSSR